MKPSPRQTQEAHQNYKKVSDHLIHEGYAADQESADDIIKGMSEEWFNLIIDCLLYTSPSPRDATLSRMPSSA